MSKTQTIVVFSGAGMSAESGIKTFRDVDGLWENHRVEDVATPEAWLKNPNMVTKFYNERRISIIEATPNEAHFAITKLESISNVDIVTQNIDDLHERAGSTSVHHLHGNIRYSKSSGPNQEREYYRIDGFELTESDVCPEGFRLRPHVVWFGESVPAFENAAAILEKADVLIVIGTSLQVYPAAGLIDFAQNAAHKFIIDPKADILSVPDDYRRVSAKATEGMLGFFDEIKNMLSDE